MWTLEISDTTTTKDASDHHRHHHPNPYKEEKIDWFFFLLIHSIENENNPYAYILYSNTFLYFYSFRSILWSEWWSDCCFQFHHHHHDVLRFPIHFFIYLRIYNDAFYILKITLWVSRPRYASMLQFMCVAIFVKDQSCENWEPFFI